MMRILAAAIWLFGNLGAATAAVDESAAPVSLIIGGRIVLVPLPAGQVRCDGINSRWDQAIENMLPAANRLLANFGSPEDRAALREGEAPPFTRSFNVQILRSNETVMVTDRVFDKVRESSRKEVGDMKGSIQAEVDKAVEAGNRKTSGDLGVDPQLTIGEMTTLGTFEDSAKSFGFTMALTAKGTAPDGGEKKLRQVVAALLVPVNGRLLLLYSNAEFRDSADRLDAERSVLAWRDAILAANPTVARSARYTVFDRIRAMGWPAVSGAVAGGAVVVGLVIYRRLRKRKSGN